MQSLPGTATKGSASHGAMAVGRFLAELVGMCAVMCAGGGLLSGAAFAVAQGLGYPNLVQQSPYLSVVLVTVCLSLPMAVYMAARGHGRRHNLEMTAATVGVGVVVLGLLWSGVISTGGLSTWRDVFGLVCGPACLIMAVQMSISFKMYSGRTHHQRRVP